MPVRRLPVRPDLTQLKHQAKDHLKALRLETPDAKLAEAQHALAKEYQAENWPRLVHACELVDAIWRDDIDAVQALVTREARLLHEETLIRKDSNWGPPMSYAANLGRDAIIRMLHGLGATDHRKAIDRAVLQGRVETARMLHELMGRPPVPSDLLSGAAYTLSAAGTSLVFDLGGTLETQNGRVYAPVEVVLQTDSRHPGRKHAILAMYVAHGLSLPETPTMAVHRGRIDLLERHLSLDSGLLTRTFDYDEIFPRSLGCDAPKDAWHGTPLAGATLLHLAIEYDEIEIVHWLLQRGAPVDVRAATDADGFGGHTPLFSTVVSGPNFWGNHGAGISDAPLTRTLLERGADPRIRASLRKPHDSDAGPELVEYRDVTPLEWGARYRDRLLVSEPAMQLIRGGSAPN